MTKQEFIFTGKFPHRIYRHLLFWFIYCSQVFLFRYYVPDLKYLSYASTYFIRLQNLLFFLPVSVFYAYFAMYFLLPRFILKGRYKELFIIALLLSILLALFSYLLTLLFDIRLAFDMPVNRSTIVRQLDFTVNNGLVFPLTVSAFAIGIKMSKNFYRQQKQNEQLVKQKIDAEVQLLKSQIHPRFLFHSLASIYNDMVNGARQSPEMLLKLSDLLSYILYESDEERVPLEKELSLLQNYIELEKAGWADRLIVNTQNDIDTRKKFIAPLLLLPLAEYVFEQADRNKQQDIFLKMEIHVKEKVFAFLLTISGHGLITDDSIERNVQLLQIQKRLRVLYANRHEFKYVISKNDVIISLSLDLQDVTATPNRITTNKYYDQE